MGVFVFPFLSQFVLKKNLIVSIATYNTPNTVHFKFRVAKDFIPSIDVSGNMNILRQKHSLTNLTALTSDGVPETFVSPEAILYQFCDFRLKLYEKRWTYLLLSLKQEMKNAVNKCRFIRAVADRTIDMLQTDSALGEAIGKLGIDQLDGSFQYLLDLPTGTLLSRTKATALETKADSIRQRVELLGTITPKDLWIKDLLTFETEYKQFLKKSPRRDDC